MSLISKAFAPDSIFGMTDRELAKPSSCSRCSGIKTKAAFGRPIAIGTPILHWRYLNSQQYYCHLFMGQYTSNALRALGSGSLDSQSDLAPPHPHTIPHGRHRHKRPSSDLDDRWPRAASC